MLLLSSIAIYSSRRSTIAISGIEIDCYHKGGKEYILAKDLLLLGFEAVLEEKTLFLDCTVPKSQLTEKNIFPAIKPDTGLMARSACIFDSERADALFFSGLTLPSTKSSSRTFILK